MIRINYFGFGRSTLALGLQETGVNVEGMRPLAGRAQSVGREGWQTPSLAPHTFHASGFGVCGNSPNVGTVGWGAADGEEVATRQGEGRGSLNLSAVNLPVDHSKLSFFEFKCIFLNQSLHP